MTIGFHSPLPPAPTGVADYARALLELLARRGKVEVGAKRAAVHLYHIGNNQLHAEIYRRALEVPGVVVLHDAVLHHFFLGSLTREAYAEEFVYNYGAWSRALAEELWRDRARSASDERYYRYPMLRRLAERSLAIVVHNPAAARMVRQHAPRARVVEIPHLFWEPMQAAPGEVEWLRSKWRDYTFAVMGYLRESKRLSTIFKVFDELSREGTQAKLLLAGEFASPAYEKALAHWLSREWVIRYNWLPEREFWLVARAVDALINLRWPSAGETSGLAIRMMGLGKPVVLSACEENSVFPDEVCLKIDAGVPEAGELRCAMQLLATERSLGAALGKLAAAHIRRKHAVEVVAESFWKLLSECRENAY